jgi:hypothetical protein
LAVEGHFKHSLTRYNVKLKNLISRLFVSNVLRKQGAS